MSAEFAMPQLWAIYLAVFVAPFIQEDAAVVGSASAASLHPDDAGGIFLVSLLGLIMSDGWKYWAGYFAQSWPPAARLTNNPKIATLKEAVLSRLGLALLGARFIPGTRIPLYLACGVFRAPFRRFLPLIALTASLYLGLTYGLFAALGEIVGARLQHFLPFVMVGIVITVIAVTVITNFIKSRRGSANS
ncbi:DedA family protein [Candidatus Viadribacter manganicus]|uniref:VTT domain-containing protein n=1 Tax=Candidatus Viadribacter manganicus TaxID=1759059 RepID=A0A1B1AJP2_9PROT|nr:VTT domain-containing protein [Candidatus Viadribacter manganicus]ANP46788.1 hypothetical protein ATE48_13145 [Candidatus Viadribacter manganicus]